MQTVIMGEDIRLYYYLDAVPFSPRHVATGRLGSIFRSVTYNRIFLCFRDMPPARRTLYRISSCDL